MLRKRVGILLALWLVPSVLTAATTGRTIVVYPPSGGGGNSFETMDAPSGTDPVADSSTDILQLLATSPIEITGDSTADSLTWSCPTCSTGAHTTDTGPVPDCTGTDGQLADASCVDLATQAELDALDTSDDDLSDDDLGALQNVVETGEGSGIPLVGDGASGWQPASTTACLSDGTNCPVDDTGTDDQTATEVPYTPTTGADWTDPDPTEVGGALDTLAGRSGGATTEAELESDLTDVSDVYTDLDAHASLTSTGIDGDGDGSEEIDCDGTNCGMGVTPSAESKLFVSAETGDYSIITDSTWTVSDAAEKLVEFRSSQVVVGWIQASGAQRWLLHANGSQVGQIVYATPAGNPGMAFLTGDSANRFDIANTGSAFEMGYGTAGDALRITANDTVHATNDFQVDGSVTLSPSTATCADTGDANPGSATLTPSTSKIDFTNSDSDGCDVTWSESGAKDGQTVKITVVSNAGGTVSFADTAGVQETGTGCDLSEWGVAVFDYTNNDRWVLASCRESN